MVSSRSDTLSRAVRKRQSTKSRRFSTVGPIARRRPRHNERTGQEVDDLKDVKSTDRRDFPDDPEHHDAPGHETSELPAGTVLQQGDRGDQRTPTDDGQQNHAGKVVADEIGAADPGRLLGDPVRHQRKAADHGAQAVKDQQPKQDSASAIHRTSIRRLVWTRADIGPEIGRLRSARGHSRVRHHALATDLRFRAVGGSCLNGARVRIS